jgi:hypothetical protein
MSDPVIAPGNPRPLPLPLTALTERWLEVWRDGGAWGYGLLTVGLYRDLRQMRQTWLADLTRTTDRYLRSPAFLELVRLGLRAAPMKSSASTQLE